MFKPNKYQEAIYREIQTGTGNIAINAVAGSGKTTTLIQAYQLLPRNKSVIFLAFNKHIAESLAAKMPGADCRTIHSLGNMALRNYGKITMNEYKVVDLADEVLASVAIRRNDDYKAIVNVVRDTVNMAKLTLTDLNNGDTAYAMMEHYGIADDVDAIKNLTGNFVIEKAAEVLAKSNHAWRRNGVVDFNDMLYIPCQFNLPVKQYDVVMVDEAQDLSNAQLGIVLRAAEHGRVIAVGDPRQAINGFAGANNDSFYQIVNRTNARVLPLSVCYRCPRSHIQLAQNIVPEIEWHEDANEGTIQKISPDQVSNMIHAGDLVICRVNAPLVGAALKLISSGIQARVRGRNIAEGLVKLTKEAGRVELNNCNQDFKSDFPRQLSLLVEHKIAVLSNQKNKESTIETLIDRKQCILSFMEAKPNLSSIEQLCDELSRLFADDKAAVWLSSIHRAKGLEANRVFVLNPDKMMFNNAEGWQLEQEYNLKYVGLTRSKESLYFVQQ